VTAAVAAGQVTCVDGFLNDRQCADLLDDLDHAWWWPSPLVRRGPDGTLVSGPSYRRTSMTTSEEWLGQRSRHILGQVERRLARRFGTDPDHLERWQITRYRRGQYFDEHHDAGFFGADADVEPGTPDGGVGALPGGVGPVGPTSPQMGPRIDDVMKEVLKLQRQVTKLAKQVGG